MATKTTKPLTARAEAFCHEFVVDHNGSAAARRAGFAEGSAGVTACRLLKDDRVKALIQELEAASRSRVEDLFWPTLERMMRGEQPTRTEMRWYQTKQGDMKPYDSKTYDVAAALTLAQRSLGIGKPDDQPGGEFILRIEGPGTVTVDKKPELQIDGPGQVVQ